ncbi:MAG: glycosyltransferase [Candidatus Thermoplasmatota archaeon]|nr:glycosyltransferase [Candidatus Thermoplasmatota archaeon]MCG2827557.1 glycosyltransferase [Thermoplasmatales archaeon]
MNILYIYHWTKIAPAIQPNTSVNLYTGKTTNMWRFAEAVATKKNVHVHIISDYIEPKYPAVEKYGDNITIYRLEKRFPTPFGQLFRRIIDARFLAKKIIKKENIDAIFFDFSPWPPALYPTMGSYLKFNIPVVMHGDTTFKSPTLLNGVENRPDTNLMLRYIHKADVIHTLAPHQKRQFMERGYPNNRIFVIPNPVNPDKYSPKRDKGMFRKAYNIRKDEIIVSYVKGKEDRAERFLGVVAPSLLEKYDVKICMFGSLSKSLIDKYSQPNIIFAGPLPKEMFLDALATTDISFILQQESIGEHSTVTRLGELAMCGVPLIILEDKSFLWTNMEDAVLCGLDKGNDAVFKENMMKSLSTLIEDKELRKNIGRNARETAKEKFGYKITAEKMIEMFKSAVK